jgi:hypothetical protein
VQNKKLVMANSNLKGNFPSKPAFLAISCHFTLCQVAGGLSIVWTGMRSLSLKGLAVPVFYQDS